ncbi:MAG: MFS transporter [Candidatus Dormibacteraeota bacterium]|nr:MFS transporter [Candidatus Dormibacteraeota bacterium]
MAAAAAPGPTTAQPRLGTVKIALLTSYWLALGYLWLPLGSQVLPILILHSVGDAHKGTGVAILEGVGTFIAVFWQPVMGAVSDRTNSRFGRRKPFIVVGTLGSILFLVLMVFTPTGRSGGSGMAVFLAPGYLYLLVLYFLLQVSENAAQAPYQGLLPDVVPERERSRASGFVGAGNLLGLAIGFYAVGTFMGSNRPDLALVSMAAVLAASMLVVVLVFPDRVKPDPGLHTSWRDVLVGTFAISPRKYSDFLWLMTSRLTILVAIAGLQRYAVFYFKDVFYPGTGAHLEQLASIAARDLQVVIVLFALVVSLPAAELSHRTGRKPIILGAAILGAMGTVGLIASPYRILPGAMIDFASALFSLPPNLSQALYFGILVGVAAGAFLAVDWAFMMDVIPTEEAGRFLGFSNIATAGSGVIAGFVGGFLIDYFNNRGHIFGQPGGYPATFIVYIFSFVVGGLVIFKVRETRGRRRAPAG